MFKLKNFRKNIIIKIVKNKITNKQVLKVIIK